MPATKPTRPTARPMLSPRDVDADDMPRAFDEVQRALSRLEMRVKDRAYVVTDLAVGVNRINHGLGKVPVGASVTPTTADATWAWAVTDKSATQIEITTVGVAQTGATVEVF